MFIRLKRRLLALRTPRSPFQYALDAVCVQSLRKDGKPRQKVIKHLAQIKEDDLDDPQHQMRFWKQVEQNLDTLGLEPEIRQSLEEKLRKKVAFPK